MTISLETIIIAIFLLLLLAASLSLLFVVNRSDRELDRLFKYLNLDRYDSKPDDE